MADHSASPKKKNVVVCFGVDVVEPKMFLSSKIRF